jgi:2-polyprenyl-3-methyl-5-hydroxy-6-metoxy-1,4-benzoquinol methylase
MAIDRSSFIERFDGAASSYASVYSNDNVEGNFFRQRCRIVNEILSNIRGGRVLDVGCGPGLMAPVCRSMGLEYSGVDISPGMIEKCRRDWNYGPQTTFEVGCVQSLPHPSDQFDAVLCLGVLEYIHESETQQALFELARVLKPGGLLICSYLNNSSLYWWWERHVYLHMTNAWIGSKNILRRLRRDSPIGFNTPRDERTFFETEIRGYYERAALRVDNTNYYGVNITLAPLDRKFTRISLALNRILEKRRMFPSWGALAFMVTANKDS